MAKKDNGVEPELVIKGVYAGRPILIFGTPDTRFPFSFGKVKAALLLAAIDKMGPQKFRDYIDDFVKAD